MFRMTEEQVDVDRGLRAILTKLVWGGAAQAGGPVQQTGTVPLGAPVHTAQLGGCSRLTDRSLALLARNCPQLQQLELQRCRNKIQSAFTSA